MSVIGQQGLIREWKQAAQVEAGLRREFLARAERAEAEVEQLRIDLRKLSDAYLRLRTLIPGAFKTPHGPSPEQVWDTTERALEAAMTAPKPARNSNPS